MSTHRRARARGGALATAPWRRAPVLLLRRPVVFLAVLGAAAVLAVAAASGPLFLSTLGTASLAAQAQQTCPENSQPGLLVTARGPQVAATTRIATAALRRQGLPAPRVATVGEATWTKNFVHVFSGPGALDHVHRLTPSAGAGPGVWVPDTFAARAGVRPGGSLAIGRGDVRVAGVYRDMAPSPFELADLPRYWCSQNDAIVPGIPLEQGPGPSSIDLTPAPFLITDPATVARLADIGRVRVSLHSPLSPSDHPLGAFDRAVEQTHAAAAAIRCGACVDPHLAALARRAHHARAGLAGSVVPIELAGVLVAGLLVGGAGLFWAGARSREIRLLVARGVGPGALGWKAVLETAPAALVGGVLGWAATAALVRAVGPADVLERDAPWQALGLAAAVLAAGLALIGVVGAAAGRERTVGRRRTWLRLVPWELVLLGGAIAVAVRGGDRPAVQVEQAIVRVSPTVVIWPLLAATGVLLLLGRLVAAALPLTGRTARRGPVAWFLAVRRLARARVVAVAVLVATALPCCLLLYGNTVRTTLGTEVTAKYHTNLGAPHVLQVYGTGTRTLPLTGASTQVVLYDQDSTVGGEPVSVLGIDPASFARAAFLTDGQRADLRRLERTGGDGVPALLVNDGGLPGGEARTRLRISHTDLRVDPVAAPAVFPGLLHGSFPLVVVRAASLARVDGDTERTVQIWTDSAGVGQARRAVAAAGGSVLFERTSDVVVDGTGLLPVTWIVDYLGALAVLVGVVALAGLVFGLAARTRSRRVSYVLSRRMGLSRSAHVASLLAELVLVLGVGWAAGSALGVSAFAAVRGRLDVYPSLPPPPPFVLPGGTLVATAAVVAAVVVLAAIATQALADRTRPAEILRLE